MLWTSIDLNTRDRLRPALTALQHGGPCDLSPAAARLPDQLVPLEPGDLDRLTAFRTDRQALLTEVERARADGFPDFEPAALDTLAAHQLVPYAGRLIVDAQPSLSPADRRTLESRIGTALPDAVARLWSASFGGDVPYALDARFPGIDRPVRLRFNELYFSDSSHHQTLEGAMQHERQLVGTTGPLPWLPIGGFEVLERVLVRTDDGSVWVRRQALPPSWTDPLTDESLARLADDVDGLFAAMFVDTAALLAEGSIGLELLDFRLKELARQDPDLYGLVRRAYLSAAR